MAVGLYLLACHALGDFPLQTDRMAQEKFDDWGVRWTHCLVYTLSFIPFAIIISWSLSEFMLFGSLLFITHFIIDSRRWKEAIPIWYDQALHVIALAFVFGVVDSGIL